MHPELERLDQQYRQLVADVSAGYVSQAEAEGILAGMTVPDGEGFVWSIDPYSGQFVRAVPGQMPVPADPDRFAVSQLPPMQVPVPPHGTPPQFVSDYLHPALQPTPPVPAGARLRSAASGAAGGALSGLGRLAGRVFRRKDRQGPSRRRTVLVVAGVVLVSVFLVSRSPSQSTSEETAVSTVPAPPATIIVPGVDPDPSSTVPGSTVPGSTVPAAPSDAQLAALTSLLNDGPTAALGVALPADAASRRAFAPLLGLPRAGFPLSVGRVKGDVSSKMSVQILAGDPAAPSAKWTVSASVSAAGWKLLSARRISG